MSLSLPSIRRDFPLLREKIDGVSIVYLDSAATAQIPTVAIEAMDMLMRTRKANVHRGLHPLADAATVTYEHARRAVQTFLHARHPEEIIFTKNATEAINLVARSWGDANLNKGDVVVLSVLEHHANIVPWLQLKERKGIVIEYLDIDGEGRVSQAHLDRLLERGTVKLLSITAQSNVLGVRPPLDALIGKARAAGAKTLVDASQFSAHHPTDVQELGCDFLVLSGHKLYGPMGIGALYGRIELLERMPPFLGGGGMITEVHEQDFSPADVPARFEAGTPPVTEAAGLAAALTWLATHDWNDIESHEHTLMSHAFTRLRAIDGLSILGPTNAADASGAISFVLDGVHPHDLTDALGKKGICMRAGHHCTQPLHRRLGIPASTRLSIGIYTSAQDIDAAADVITALLPLLR